MFLAASSEVSFNVISFPEVWYNFTVVADRWAAVLIVGSVLIGLLIKEVFRKTRDIQKWAVDILVIRVPIFLLIVVYVYSGLYRLLNLV